MYTSSTHAYIYRMQAVYACARLEGRRREITLYRFASNAPIHTEKLKPGLFLDQSPKVRAYACVAQRRLTR